MRALRSAFVAMTVGMVLAGCKDDLATPTDFNLAELDVAQLAPGVHAVITVPDLRMDGGGTTANLHLVSVGGDYTVVSFQGELEWNPDRLEISDIQEPDAILAAWNLVRPGLIRFAGVALEGVGGEPILELRIYSADGLSSEMFEVRMEELIEAEGFGDLLPQYASGSHPSLARSLDGVVN